MHFLKIKNIQIALSIILLIGLLISLSLVLIGGLFYLFQYGYQPFQVALFTTKAGYPFNMRAILQHIFSFTSTEMIEFGLLILVATQIIRVALLTYFYLSLRDIWFTLFSFFILAVLIYSSFLRY